MEQNAESIETQAVDSIELTTGIVSANVSKNSVRPNDLPDRLASIHAALTGLGEDVTAEPRTQKLSPSQIRKSVTPDALISFVDGQSYKTLKRHLTGNGMTMEEYRERFGLPRDYPSTAANYSAQRSALAKSLGLGQQRGDAAPKAAQPDATVSEHSKRPGRSRKNKAAA